MAAFRTPFRAANRGPMRAGFAGFAGGGAAGATLDWANRTTATAAGIGTSVTINYPPANAGDVFALIVGQPNDNTGGSPGYAITGFTFQEETGDGLNDAAMELWYRVATGSEGASVTFTPGDRAICLMAVFSEVTPTYESSMANSAGGAAPTAAAPSVSVSNSPVLHAFLSRGSTVTGFPAGLVDSASIAGAFGSMGVGYTNGDGGASPGTWTQAASVEWATGAFSVS